MKILHIISSGGFYGAERVLLDLLKLSNNNGDQASLLCLKNFAAPEPQVHKIAVSQGLKSRVITCNSRFDLKAISDIRKIVHQEDYKFMHAHGYKSNFYSVIVSHMAKVPVISTFHGWTWTGADKKLWLYEKMDKWVAKRISRLISVSPAIVDELLKHGVNSANIKLIYNGIDTGHFDPEKTTGDLRQHFGLMNNFVIGVAGRLSKEKGHSYLIEAFKNASSVMPDAKLLIVGSGPLKDKLLKEACELEIADKIIFAGNQADMPALYKTMDAFVLPSLTEGLPLTLLEAMSMKLAVVATSVGAVPYVLNNDCGILVEPENKRDLQRTLFFLYENAQARRELGEKARKRVSSGFSLQDMYKQYLEVYREITSHA